MQVGQWAPVYPEGRFRTLTTCWEGHPADRPPREDDNFVMQRFLDDKRREPLAAYATGNMLWRGDVARPL
eukprot:3767708-Heterocapsa_arctica.AAC.1